MKSVLVTGGTGYIGSHTVIELMAAGYDPVIVDNLSNSKRAALDRIGQISGKHPEFYELDLLDENALEQVFRRHAIDAVLHFAGLKAVGESVREPLKYYRNNVEGTLCLYRVMRRTGCGHIVFSSSATVYGDPHTLPIREDFPLYATNPYGRTKLMIEQILTDLNAADPGFNVMLLRYFNPVGAHQSGLIGEDPHGIPNNLMPYIAQVATGRLKELSIFGDDYDTPDGTGIRDYIHVVDLAMGHVKALAAMSHLQGVRIYNLGTGRGYSVLDMVKAFSQARGQEIPYRFSPRRAGDVAACYADSSKAEAELGWVAAQGIREMCEDTWRWQSQNPQGLE
ncbi:MAG: UDP-glucose 4-epimerase GalE [Verrucomicrobiota bacterium]